MLFCGCKGINLSTKFNLLFLIIYYFTIEVLNRAKEECQESRGKKEAISTLTNANCVASVLVKQQLFGYTKESILERSLMNANYVENVLVKREIWRDM